MLVLLCVLQSEVTCIYMALRVGNRPYLIVCKVLEFQYHLDKQVKQFFMYLKCYTDIMHAQRYPTIPVLCNVDPGLIRLFVCLMPFVTPPHPERQKKKKKTTAIYLDASLATSPKGITHRNVLSPALRRLVA